MAHPHSLGRRLRASLEAKQVVTSFIQHGRKILILKRSEKVGTHRGLWAGVSGYLEKKEEPLVRALKEIKEETEFSEDHIELVKAGESIGIPDYKNNTLWIIYPHLFRTSRAEPRTDWEHVEYRWIEPEELLKYKTVPGLNETLQKVLPTPIDRITTDPEVQKRILNIEADQTHGAAFLAIEAVRTLVRATETDESNDIETHLAHLKTIAERLMDIRPSMASLHNVVGELLSETVKRGEKASSTVEIKEFVKREADLLIEASKKARRTIAERAAKMIPENGRVITHSYSETVLETLKRAHGEGRHFEVFVPESRPLFEGRRSAEELADQGVPVTVVTDAAAGYFAANASIALLGADSIFADGSVVNKVGTFPIVLSAAYQGVPVYVLAEINKIHLRSYFSKVRIEEKDPKEVWADAPSKINIRNLYFDLTPKFFLTGVITEVQKLRPDEILRICQETVQERYII
jgi:ribose 1,5-bisphosphate isomerase